MSSIITPCAVYKCSRKQHTYIYINEKDNFDDIPEVLMKTLGDLSFVMELELYPERSLAQADAAEVIDKLKAQGFYLQLPPADYQPEI